MNGCQGHTSLCDGRDLMPVKLGLRRVLLVMCAGCRSTMLAIAVIVEQRQREVPVTADRRHSFRPAWLTHLTARDETGRMVA